MTIEGERKAQTHNARRFVHLFSFVAQCPALCRIILCYGVRAGLNNRFQFTGQSIYFSICKYTTQNTGLSSLF